MKGPVARGPRTTPASRFGVRLAHERKRQCKSMATLARIAEMHSSQIGLLERGLLDVRLSTVVRLARALDVPLCDLLDEVDRPPGAPP